MTRSNRKGDQVLTPGSSSRRPKNKKPINSSFLKKIEPLTENQQRLFDYYDQGKNIFAHGVPGSGKTFVLLYKALKEVLDERTPYEKIYLIRSIVPTRNLGFLPGDLISKTEIFENPYRTMVKRMFDLPNDVDLEMLYGNLKAQGTITFWTTSFLRGDTIDNAIIIVDEGQNLNSHECFTVITRCGLNTRIMFAGDVEQSDLTKASEKEGIVDFMKIIDVMPSFEKIEFGVDDICRSPLVKEFVIAKKSLGL